MASKVITTTYNGSASTNVKLEGVSPGLGELLYENVRKHPGNIAIEFGERKVTYAELHCYGLILSRQLVKRGLKAEEPVAIITDAGIDQIIAQVAIIYSGGVCCGLDPSLPEKEIKDRLLNAACRLCLLDDQNMGRLKDFTMMAIPSRPLTVDDVELAIQCPPSRSTISDQLCHLMHTSGSTGKSKAVRIKSKAILQVARCRRTVPISSRDRVAQIGMVSFDVSMWEIWVTMIHGATIIPIRRSIVSDVFQLSQLLTELAVTAILVPAALLSPLVLASPTVFSKMNVVYSGGEAPNLAAMQSVLETAPPKHMFNGYGPTECCIFSLVREITLEDAKKRCTSLNIPVGETKYMILNDQYLPVATGETGELFLGGDGVSPGYLNLAEKTAERFLTSLDHPTLDSSCNWFATGDLAQQTSSGDIQIVGRKDYQVKIRGFRIELEGVEAALMETGFFYAASACKVQRDDDQTNAILVAFVVPKSADFNVKDAIALLEKQLPGYMIPRIEIHEKLPLNGHCKVDRHQLVRDYLENATARQAESHRSTNDASIIERLRKIWYSVLPSYGGEIRYTDDFLTIGGSSLQAAMLLIRIKKEFGTQLTAVDIFEHTTLAGMADLIGAGNKSFRLDEVQNQLFRKDASLFSTLNLRPLADAPVNWNAPSEGHIFLTGATGYVGAFTLHAMLTLPEVKSVTCLVRGDTQSDARARVMKTQAQYCLDSNSSAYDKLVVIEGSLDHETLGLGTEKFLELAEQTSAIFHLAAHVNYAHPYVNHRTANVIGTATLLRLQSIGKPKRLHYMSSISIYGPTGLIHNRRSVGENDSPMKYIDSVQYDNGYAQSKWVSEKLVYDAIQSGFPITIYRPGSVFCHSVTGVGNASDFNSRLMLSCLRMKCFPTMMDQSKNFIPVDYLTKAMLHLSKRDDSIGQGYNLVPELLEPPTTELQKTFKMVEEASGVSLEELPYRTWLDRLQAQDDSDPLRPLLPMLDEKVFNGLCRWETYAKMPIYETSNLKRHLQSDPTLGKCPPLSMNLLKKFLTNLGALDNI
ncbi:antibiotic synthetase [Penicillium lagena]|uniref:antibiotic synthetase n=1 Tax=Penicillium lagena TaxID=94218 RepID=UPI0025401DE6|nr:antibiotic synthetase [Penicillium lagena]KAJ5612601.1 antibiotic synthetase [Penicillium lagena]